MGHLKVDKINEQTRTEVVEICLHAVCACRKKKSLLPIWSYDPKGLVSGMKLNIKMIPDKLFSVFTFQCLLNKFAYLILVYVGRVESDLCIAFANTDLDIPRWRKSSAKWSGYVTTISRWEL